MRSVPTVFSCLTLHSFMYIANFMMIQLIIWQLLTVMPAFDGCRRDVFTKTASVQVQLQDTESAPKMKGIIWSPNTLALGLDHHLHAKNKHHDAVDLRRFRALRRCSGTLSSLIRLVSIREGLRSEFGPLRTRVATRPAVAVPTRPKWK